MLEREFVAQILQLARLFGWKVHYIADSRRSPVGFPDLTLYRGGRLIFFEAKQEKGKVRPGQAEWIADLACVPGVVARIVRPSDLEEIAGMLK